MRTFYWKKKRLLHPKNTKKSKELQRIRNHVQK